MVTVGLPGHVRYRRPIVRVVEDGGGAVVVPTEEPVGSAGVTSHGVAPVRASDGLTGWLRRKAPQAGSGQWSLGGVRLLAYGLVAFQVV